MYNNNNYYEPEDEPDYEEEAALILAEYMAKGGRFDPYEPANWNEALSENGIEEDIKPEEASEELRAMAYDYWYKIAEPEADYQASIGG